MDVYVLFPNHTNGMQLYRKLAAQKIPAVIVPTPRQISSSCGISLKIDQRDEQVVRLCVEQEQIQITDIVSLSCNYSSHRDKYC